MNEKEITNSFTATGYLKEEPHYSHSVYGEDFYGFDFTVERLSGMCDVLPCIISSRLRECIKPGVPLEIYGQIRSYNRVVDGINRLEIRTFVREICETAEKSCVNDARLTGYICKPPVYRVTPFGREITDMLIAVNRRFSKSDYIPVIAWGRNARLCSTLSVGEKLAIAGRLQSREYEKKTEEKTEKRTAYELSACTVRLPEEVFTI